MFRESKVSQHLALADTQAGRQAGSFSPPFPRRLIAFRAVQILQEGVAADVSRVHPARCNGKSGDKRGASPPKKRGHPGQAMDENRQSNAMHLTGRKKADRKSG